MLQMLAKQVRALEASADARPRTSVLAGSARRLRVGCDAGLLAWIIGEGFVR
jgi:hypothetical protein